MNTLQFPIIPAATATEVCAQFELQAAALAILSQELSPAEFFSRLEERRLSVDAINLLAHGLPHREAIFWACRCVEKYAAALPPEGQEAWSAAQKWVQAPTGNACQAARDSIKNSTFQNAGAWTAQAVSWAGSAEQAALTGKAVSAAVQMAAALGLPDIKALLDKLTAAWSVALGQLSQSPGWAVHLPQANLPAIPAIGALLPTPALPTIAMPNLPAMDMTQLENFPRVMLQLLQVLVPSLVIPPLPGITGPALPGLPGMPQVNLTMGLPGIALPTLPGLAGQLPSITLPSLPGTPTLPALGLSLPTMPSLDGQLNIPAIPGINLTPEQLLKVFHLHQPFLEIGARIARGELVIPPTAG
jgi:hypothetical protein